MAAPTHRFGEFLLDAQARELFHRGRRVSLPLSTVDCLIHLVRHRDRPVGRDELAAAVWGRADVSEVSLSHAIMRLRRVLGDDGNAQRMIRTVPRLGWRWVMQDTREEDSDAVRPDDDAARADVAPVVTVAGDGRQSRGRLAWPAIAAAVALATTFAVLAFHRTGIRAEAPAPATAAAIVLPASVDAPPEWSWLRLGLMDLLATRLRRGALATVPSETVLAMLDARPARALPASWRIEPSVTFARGRWSVVLDAHGPGRTLETRADGADAVSAARAAGDELLIKLGHTPPLPEAGEGGDAAALLRQRINAALLAGQIDIARGLVADAAPPLRNDPEIAASEAKIAFFAGDYARSREKAIDLLGTLPAGSRLRARAFNTLGAACYRLGRLDESAKAYDEAIRLADAGSQPDVLATAWIGRGGVASDRLQLDEAAAAYGHARTLLTAANDAFGVAAVDLNLGINALQRGQPASALPLLPRADEAFGRYAAEDALGATLVAEIDAQLALLDTQGALATAARIEPLERRAGNPRQQHELAVARADALLAAGRLAAADTLLARVLDQADPAADEVVRAHAQALAGEVAFARGEFAKAAELARAARVPALAARLHDAYADAWLLSVRALREAGQGEASGRELEGFRAWAAESPLASDRIRVALASAEQDDAAGHVDRALQGYVEAMAAAAARGIPAELVRVGTAYVRALLAAGRSGEAAAVNGRMAPWADRDARAAASAARVYTALGDEAAASASRSRALVLAGERPFEFLTR